jgi:serine phosphatase RsbU (regulator of sigma subunit)
VVERKLDFKKLVLNTVKENIISTVDDLLKKSALKDIELAIDLAKEAKILSEEHFYTKGLVRSLILLGKKYQNISNYGESMKAALQAMELAKGLEDIDGEADCLDVLGGVYNFLGDYNKRLDCNLKCLALREKVNNLPAQLSTTNNIGDTYMELGDFKNALRYFKLCLSFPDLTPSIKAIVYSNIGEVYFHLKEYDSVPENIEKGLKYGEESSYWQIIIAAYLMQAKMLIIENKEEDALIPLDKGQKIAIEKGNKEEEYILYLTYAKVYGKLNQYDKAYLYLNKYHQLKEELLTDNSAQKLKKIEFEFQFKSIKNEAEETKEKNKLLTRAFNQIETQRNEIELKNLSITDSIKYAKRIQNSILPAPEKVKSLLIDSFVFYQPKDIVSGDFYWIDKIGDEIIFSVIDCTGHGVPGAFVSLIAHNALNKVISEKQVTKPSQILTEIDQIMIDTFSKSETTIRDGMDMGICSWNIKTNKLQFSGAYHSLFMHSENEFVEIKGNRESIGFSFFKTKSEFVNHVIDLKPGAMIYLSSDGFPDQFGGEKGKKMKWKGFKNFLNQINSLSVKEQLPQMSSYFSQWQGELEQLDDVCVIGVRFS